MKKIMLVVLFVFAVIFPSILLSMPTVYPTGTTIYNPEKAWNGYTIFPSAGQQGAVLIDMNGNVVKVWKGLLGEPASNKMLPGGYVYGSTSRRSGHQDYTDLSLVDWDGNIVWQFNKTELIEDPGEEPKWYARLHHDYQIEGNPTGYYVPGMNFKKDGNRLILSHKDVKNPKISDKVLVDDLILEVNNKGEILWQWLASDHFDELGFDYDAINSIYRSPNYNSQTKVGDWMHVNSMSWVGPNKWYDQGDERFHPDNIIIDGRETNIIAIIDKKTGKIVYRIGPDYTSTPALRKLGQIIGQHHAHIIPQGLPGEGNILIFDNGGDAGFGAPTSQAPTGNKRDRRDYSRVIEVDPITLEIVWQLDGEKLGYSHKYKFYSFNVSSAQRLPNGNTLVTEGAEGRLFEVTPDLEIVWEYISTHYVNSPTSDKKTWNMIYRAYRLPYEWVPQLPKPEEIAIIPPANWEFHVPGSSPKVLKNAITDLKAKPGINGTKTE